MHPSRVKIDEVKWKKKLKKMNKMNIIVAAALIHFSHNFGQNFRSKMRLLIELRLLFESGYYYSRYNAYWILMYNF